MPLDKTHSLNPNKWVELYADYLFNYTIKRVDNHEIAKDIIQETFYSALKSVPNFKGLASERTWLISILKRKIIDYYRKVNSIKGKSEIRINFHQSGEQEGNWIEERVPAKWASSSDYNLEQQELSLTLTNCIEKLPEKYAMVFKMKTIQEMDTEDICKDLDISPSNLWVIIHRARTQLRGCMEENWFKK
ncbi:MAG: RNA polymerase subunit sigma-70 [Flavobacteriaceae bacterium]|nr:MAG: RNA polymerase subunit sigma-70 [Flavobacteriaceae bacterium]